MDWDFVSATTIGRHLGARYGFLTMVLDMLKIIVPTVATKHLFPEFPYFLFVAGFGMVGHIWPVYHGFKGGRGILAVFGGMMAIDWIGAFATSIGGYLFGLVVLRDVLSAYAAPVILIIPWLWFRTHDPYYLGYAVFVNVVFGIAMIPEIRNWISLRKDPQWRDPTKVLELSGMGRGVLKAGRALGLIKKKPTATHRPNTSE